jgi:hypothetical protein
MSERGDEPIPLADIVSLITDIRVPDEDALDILHERGLRLLRERQRPPGAQ